MLEKYPSLKNFGFVIEKQTLERKRKIRDENGEFIYQIEPFAVLEAYVYIYSLEELMAFMDAVNEGLVIYKDGDVKILEIYDSYRE